MNNYMGDTRYEKVWEQMQLLGIEDITSKRQAKNGTRVWKLPIKNTWKDGKLIEIASFKTGYVRNQGKSTRSNFQLNKRCEGEPEYFQLNDKDNNGTPLYRKFTTRTCKLIPIEIDRLEYLISYCLKNYYIKNANRVAEGKYVSKWRYDNLADAARLDYEHREWQDKQDVATRVSQLDLQNKLDTIQRIADYGQTE